MTGEVIAVCSEIHTNQIRILCDQNVGYLAASLTVHAGVKRVHILKYFRGFLLCALIRVYNEYFTNINLFRN